jgi:hypothetical protein
VIVVQLVALVVDHEIEDGSIGETRFLVDDEPAILDCGSDAHPTRLLRWLTPLHRSRRISTTRNSATVERLRCAEPKASSVVSRAMVRCLGFAVTVLVGLFGWAGSAQACKKPHQTVFELFDEAETVAVVRVARVPAPGGRAVLTVTDSLKGRSGRLTTPVGNNSCSVRFHRGRTALVFLAADGRLVGIYDGYVERPDAALLSAVRAWSAVASASDRVAVLTTAIVGPARSRSVFDAASHLADEPSLRAELDSAAIDALAKIADAQIEAALALRAPFTDSHVQLGAREVPAWRPLGRLTADDFAGVTDPGTLADLMLEGSGERYPQRVAAMQRCDEIRGVPAGEFIRITDGTADRYWRARAEACRTGAP